MAPGFLIQLYFVSHEAKQNKEIMVSTQKQDYPNLTKSHQYNAHAQ